MAGVEAKSPRQAELEKARPLWVPDQNAPACHGCRSVFGLFTRKHHCRGCGQIFCADCSKDTIALPLLAYPDRVRTCNACYSLETRRVIFETTLCPMLIRGDTFKKHATGVVGMPRMRLIRLTEDRQFITWTKQETKGKRVEEEEERGNVPIADILEVKDSITRRLTDASAHGWSLVCKNRTLEMETMDRTLRERWVHALREARVFIAPAPVTSVDRKEQKKAEEDARRHEQRIDLERRQAKEDVKKERERRRTELRAKYAK